MNKDDKIIILHTSHAGRIILQSVIQHVIGMQGHIIDSEPVFSEKKTIPIEQVIVQLLETPVIPDFGVVVNKAHSSPIYDPAKRNNRKRKY